MFFYRENEFSFDDRPQNGDFMQKFEFKIVIFGFYRDAYNFLETYRII
ncbi:hypothetical protein LEP1GSC005_3605 [Leptospira santarosai str. ST188]|uniref:Uncharacterized protein n=1 Tax=Leptospira santarosai serovar Arenal str. MAVJ 401 TaxID=1049976 RepID=M6JWX5_9LEPT|nr:hypothetical protein LEP1GSC163_3618 [Leptospira santarosai str. CBC379]EKS08285.1 hypothetical protein LEP1GSC071_2067 [Leptospira santarosai str. JET]EMF90783.1 hypothetical protein LEP1GSC005_3605 [Leptospira santarosai str. ST188]EMN19982.1 hypothetical protein LEP1GSC063_1971 [Leptospira santarosai serovar Arenal str. MAVJ 401]EMO32123.1 hypothetical protein LEP1GSC175_3075 [Leptospira santarosai str. HAI821]EMO98432.1 hypothetical protein LEP1GSC120_2136 [Leptospira santarosai str. 20